MKKSLMSLFCVSLLALLPACWGDKSPCCKDSHCPAEVEKKTEVEEEVTVTAPTEQTEAAAPAEVTATKTVETTEEVK